MAGIPPLAWCQMVIKPRGMGAGPHDITCQNKPRKRSSHPLRFPVCRFQKKEQQLHIPTHVPKRALQVARGLLRQKFCLVLLE